MIVGRRKLPISCSVRTLYCRFESGEFDQHRLSMQRKRETDDASFKINFGHSEGYTIVGVQHKSAIITLVERLSKVIIVLKPEARKASDIKKATNIGFQSVPKNLFKSITFDCDKEFSNWRNISNTNDIDIYFADPETPSQRCLDEHSNSLLRKDILPKEIDLISPVASKKNHIPRKSLNYQPPLEVFLSYVNK